MLDQSSQSRDVTIKRDVLRQACDACRTRKARCHSRDATAESDESRSCQRCVRLRLDCTYRLPFGARGPRRKNSARRNPETSTSGHGSTRPRTGSSAQRTPETSTAGLGSSRPRTGNCATSPEERLYLVDSAPERLSSDAPLWPTSPQALSTYRSPSTSYTHTGDELCSRNLLKRILSDYLEHLYPLIPVVHRPSFRQSVCEDRDLYDGDFFGLVLGLCAITVGTMPNRFKEYKSCATPLRFQTRTEMIRYCYDRVHRLRGYGYFEHVNFHKWAASYLISIALFQIGEHNQARMIEVESMQLARLLGLHQISEYAGLNCIEAQLRKRAFWLMFYGYVHAQYQNLRKERLTYLDANILASLDLEQLMPLEVDDEWISEDAVMPQPAGVISVLVGFNTASRVFWTALQSPTNKAEDCYCERTRSPVAQYQYLKSRLHELHYMLDSLPPQLRQWQNTTNDPSLYGADPEQCRLLIAQFATTRANVHVTHREEPQ